MKKVHNLLKSGIIFSSFTLFSRILGFLRDMITANLLGSTSDVFVFAQRIPNLFRRLFAEGSFSQAFIPILSKYHSDEDNKQMKALIAGAMGWLSVITLAITVLGIIGSSWITIGLANGWYQNYLEGASNKFVHASFLLKITFPYLFFISLVALCGAVMNVVGKVALFSFTPAVLNIAMILSALILPKAFGIDANYALALGVLFGGICQLAIQIPYLYKIGFLVKPSLKVTPGLKQMFKNMVPALIGASGSQINMLVNTIVASFFLAGSMSWLYYAERLIELPLGIFGVAIATILLPTLSRKVRIYQQDNTPENRQAFNNAMDWGVKMILLIALPAMMLLILLGRYIIDLLFFHGQFNANDLYMTNLALICFAFATLPSMLTKTLTNGFYAHEDTKTPMYISLFTIGVNIVLNLVALRIDFWFLALSTSIAALLNSVILYVYLRVKGYYSFSKTVLFTFARAVIAAVVLAVFLLFVPLKYADWSQLGVFSKIVTLSLYGISGVITYLAILFILGFRIEHLVYVDLMPSAATPTANVSIETIPEEPQATDVAIAQGQLPTITTLDHATALRPQPEDPLVEQEDGGNINDKESVSTLSTKKKDLIADSSQTVELESNLNSSEVRDNNVIKERNKRSKVRKGQKQKLTQDSNQSQVAEKDLPQVESFANIQHETKEDLDLTVTTSSLSSFRSEVNNSLNATGKEEVTAIEVAKPSDAASDQSFASVTQGFAETKSNINNITSFNTTLELHNASLDLSSVSINADQTADQTAEKDKKLSEYNNSQACDEALVQLNIATNKQEVDTTLKSESSKLDNVTFNEKSITTKDESESTAKSDTEDVGYSLVKSPTKDHPTQSVSGIKLTIHDNAPTVVEFVEETSSNESSVEKTPRSLSNRLVDLLAQIKTKATNRNAKNTEKDTLEQGVEELTVTDDNQTKAPIQQDKETDVVTVVSSQDSPRENLILTSAVSPDHTDFDNYDKTVVNATASITEEVLESAEKQLEEQTQDLAVYTSVNPEHSEPIMQNGLEMERVSKPSHYAQYSARMLNLKRKNPQSGACLPRVKIEIKSSLSQEQAAQIKELRLVKIQAHEFESFQPDNSEYFSSLIANNPLLANPPEAKLIKSQLERGAIFLDKINPVVEYFNLVSDKQEIVARVKVTGARHVANAANTDDVAAIVLNKQLIKFPKLGILASTYQQKQTTKTSAYLPHDEVETTQQSTANSSVDINQHIDSGLDEIFFDFSDFEDSADSTVKPDYITEGERYDLVDETYLEQALSTTQGQNKLSKIRQLVTTSLGQEQPLEMDVEKLIVDEIIELSLGGNNFDMTTLDAKQIADAVRLAIEQTNLEQAVSGDLNLKSQENQTNDKFKRFNS